MAWNSKEGYLYRECYDLNRVKSYEFYKYCQCAECETRLKMKREPNNRITVYISDLKDNDKVQELLKNWTCEDGAKMLPIEYVRL